MFLFVNNTDFVGWRPKGELAHLGIGRHVPMFADSEEDDSGAGTSPEGIEHGDGWSLHLSEKSTY